MKNFLEVITESEDHCAKIRSLIMTIHFSNERLAEVYGALLLHLKKGGKPSDKHGQIYNAKRDCDKSFALDLLIATVETELEGYFKFLCRTSIDSLA